MWFGHVTTSHITLSDASQAFGKHLFAPAVSDVPGTGPPTTFSRPHPADPVLGADLVEGRTTRNMSDLGLVLLPRAFGMYRNFLRRQRGR
jgi:hypothetical protein